MIKDAKSSPPRKPAGDALIRRPAGLIALGLSILLIAIVAGMFAWHRIERREAMAAPAAAAERLAAAGLRLSFGAVDVSGAPARVDLSIATPRIAMEGGWSWSAAQLDLRRLVYRRDFLSAYALGPHLIATPTAAVRTEAAVLGSVVFEDDALERFSVSATELTLDFGGGLGEGDTRRADRLELHLRAPEETPPADAAWRRRVFVRIEGLELRGAVRMDAALGGTASFAAPLRRDRPPPRLEELALVEGRLAFSTGVGAPAVLAASGRLRRDETGRVTGLIAVKTAEAAQLLEALVAAQWLTDASAAAVAARAAESGALAGVLEIDDVEWRLLDAAPEAIPLTAP